jgi:hypothetical protein
VRLHGRNGLVYLSVHSGDAASPLTYLSSWAISFTHDTFDASTITDPQHRYIAGMPDVAGTFTGFLDDATSQTYIAATDGLPRNMYIYPNSRDMGQFFAGMVLPDLAVTGGEGAPVAITVNWVPSTGVTRTQDYGTYSGTYTDPYL